MPFWTPVSPLHYVKRLLPICLLLASLAVTAPPAVAQQAQSLSQAVEQVRRSTGGKVLSASKSVRGDREVYSIKVITKNGSVRTVRVSGPRVKRERERDRRSRGP